MFGSPLLYCSLSPNSLPHELCSVQQFPSHVDGPKENHSKLNQSRNGVLISHCAFVKEGDAYSCGCLDMQIPNTKYEAHQNSPRSSASVSACPFLMHAMKRKIQVGPESAKMTDVKGTPSTGAAGTSSE